MENKYIVNNTSRLGKWFVLLCLFLNLLIVIYWTSFNLFIAPIFLILIALFLFSFLAILKNKIIGYVLVIPTFIFSGGSGFFLSRFLVFGGEAPPSMTEEYFAYFFIFNLLLSIMASMYSIIIIDDLRDIKNKDITDKILELNKIELRNNRFEIFKWVVFSILGTIFIYGIVMGIKYYSQRNMLEQSEPIPNQASNQSITNSAAIDFQTPDLIKDWQIYKNDQYGFEFQYPSNLNLFENKQPGNGFFQINYPNIFEIQRYPYINNQPNSRGIYTVSLPIIQIFLSKDSVFLKGESMDPNVLEKVNVLKNIELTVELTCFNKQYPPPFSEGLPLEQDGLLDKPRQTALYQHRVGYVAETCQRLKLTSTNNILCLNLYANSNNLNDSKNFLDKILPTLKISQNFDNLNIKCEGFYF